uniref:CCHC-type domain-containing protein n=1 Tax=Chrysemys picta bellii TaxID=8478 RepID=A0A8C3FC21_CHRPI
MVELRPQLSEPLAEVAVEMRKEHMNSYELFKNKARIRMGLTPEHAHQRFRALSWKPDVSFTQHAYHIDKNCDAWVSGANVKSLEDLVLLVKMEQFLEGVPEEIGRYILDGKPKTVTEEGEIGAKWVEVAEKKKTSSSWSEYQKGQPETKPYHRGQPKAPPTFQGKPQTPSHPTTPVSTNQQRPGDTLAGQCFKCNELGHIKGHCPKNPNRLQFITPHSHQRSPGPDASLISSERRETLRVGGKKVIAWRDTGAQVSTIHQSLVDPKLINLEAPVTIQPFMSQSVTLPTAKLHVQYKGWSGMWTFSVYDNYPNPKLLGEDLATHVKLAKRVGIVTRSQAKRACTPIPVPEPSTRAPSVLPETQTKVVEPDPLPTTATAVVDSIPETQPKPVPEPELATQPVPELATQPAPEPLPALSTAFANPSTTPMPGGTSEPELAEAADNPTQEAQPEPEIQHSASADSGSQSTETAPAPALLPEGPRPSPQSKEELMSPASREQFQAE